MHCQKLTGASPPRLSKCSCAHDEQCTEANDWRQWQQDGISIVTVSGKNVNRSNWYAVYSEITADVIKCVRRKSIILPRRQTNWNTVNCKQIGKLKIKTIQNSRQNARQIFYPDFLTPGTLDPLQCQRFTHTAFWRSTHSYHLQSNSTKQSVLDSVVSVFIHVRFPIRHIVWKIPNTVHSPMCYSSRNCLPMKTQAIISSKPHRNSWAQVSGLQ